MEETQTQYEVEIEGTNFCLLHKYTTASVKDPKPRTIKVKDSSNFLDEWKRGTYLNEKGNVVIPALNLMACLFDGAKGMKIGKKALTRIIYTSLVVRPFEPEVLIKGEKGLEPITLEKIKENDWLNISGVVIKGNRVDRARTSLPIGWTVKFQIVAKENTLGKEDILSILENAGSEAGLGDWRPSAPKKPGPYGTFKVISFK